VHRLLLLTENYPPDRGGMSVSCDRIARGLRREGVHVDVVRLDRRAPDAAHTINMTWNRIRASAAGVTHVAAFGGYLPILAGPAFAARLERPLVTLIRGNELDAGLFDPRRRYALDDALRRSAAVCTVTTEQAEKIAALHPEVEPRVIANGIDFELWSATDADRARAASLRSGRRLLGFFGHLKAKKGIGFFLDLLRRRASEVQLLVAGECEEDLGGFEVARFDAVDRFALIPLYLACDFVVIPSHYDGFPNVLIEAAALGRPLLASRCGGMRDLLDERAALLFEPGDAHGARLAVDRALRMPEEELARMGAHAQALARGRCDARDEARAYVEVLNGCARARLVSVR
jgi:glycogen synthase